MWCAVFATILTVAFAADCGPAASKLELGAAASQTLGPQKALNATGTDICSGTCTQMTNDEAQTFSVQMVDIPKEAAKATGAVEGLSLLTYTDKACATLLMSYSATSTVESDKIKAGNSGMVTAAGLLTRSLTVTGGCYPTRCTATTATTAGSTPISATSTAAGSVQSVLALAFALLGVTYPM